MKRMSTCECECLFSFMDVIVADYTNGVAHVKNTIKHAMHTYRLVWIFYSMFLVQNSTYVANFKEIHLVHEFIY